MFRVLKFVAVVAFSLTSSFVMAQGYRDAGAKASGNFGTGFSSGRSNSMSYSYGRSAYYSAPQVVRSMSPAMSIPVTPQVAYGSTAVRRFSVEPGQTTVEATPVAPQVRRSFSIEPSTPAYRAPVQRQSGSMPTYLLPKTDARKFGG